MNAPMENRGLNRFAKNKILVIVLIAIFALSVIANGVQGYFMWKKIKAYRNLEEIIKNKSNCDKCPVAEPTPTPTPAPTTKSKSSGSSGQETVIPPPPPPSD